jgi:hypothetical protein
LALFYPEAALKPTGRSIPLMLPPEPALDL